MKKLRQDYKKIKDKNGLTGRGRTKWKYYDALDEVLGPRPATRPPLVIDSTSEDSPTTEAESENSRLSDEDEEQSEGGNDGDSSDSGTVSKQPKDADEGSNTKTPTKPPISKGTKRALAKADVFEGVMTKTMKIVTEVQRESDKMYFKLEEKRMEIDAQQKREERQFQLQLAQLFNGSANQQQYYPPCPPNYHHFYSQPNSQDE